MKPVPGALRSAFVPKPVELHPRPVPAGLEEVGVRLGDVLPGHLSRLERIGKARDGGEFGGLAEYSKTCITNIGFKVKQAPGDSRKKSGSIWAGKGTWLSMARLATERRLSSRHWSLLWR